MIFFQLFLLVLINISTGNEKTSLFNGKNLNGWKIYGTEKWYVNNGELICESGHEKKYGYLATEKFYKDYRYGHNANNPSSFYGSYSCGGCNWCNYNGCKW